MSTTPMTKQNEAVKLPVRVLPIVIVEACEVWPVHDVDGVQVAVALSEAKAHAIAHALNSQGKMVEMIELYDLWGSGPTPATGRALDKCIEQLRSAIQGAKEL